MPELVWAGKYDSDGARHRPRLPVAVLRTVEAGGAPSADTTPAQADWIIAGETQQVLPALLADLARQVNLLYIDPPFATGLDFTSTIPLPGSDWHIRRTAYRDAWESLDDYLRWMDETLTLLRELLADDGEL